MKHFPVRGGLFGRGAVVRAVDGVSFDVLKGETLGIVGERGCGKSTTARLLMHLMRADKGELVFDGEKVGEAHGISLNDRRQVQMVFQDSYASLNPRLTIERLDRLRSDGARRPGREARRRAHDLLASVGLEPGRFAGRYPHELSGGQRQRINIARALALEPRLVILDEAVSALDKSVEAQVLNLLRDLKEEFGLTYIFISHDLNVVRFMVRQGHGDVSRQGRRDRARRGDLAEPAHPYTAALLALVPRWTRRGARRGPLRAIRPIRSTRRPAAASTRAAPSPRPCALRRSPACGRRGTARGLPSWRVPGSGSQPRARNGGGRGMTRRRIQSQNLGVTFSTGRGPSARSTACRCR